MPNGEAELVRLHADRPFCPLHSLRNLRYRRFLARMSLQHFQIVLGPNFISAVLSFVSHFESSPIFKDAAPLSKAGRAVYLQFAGHHYDTLTMM